MKKSIIQKTKTRVDHYYHNNDQILIHNTESNELTLVYGQDGMIGVSSLEAGLAMIKWDSKIVVNPEFISWL